MGTVPAATVMRAIERVAEPSARLGLIAAQYGMQEEAVALLTQAARHDLLTHVLQARGIMVFSWCTVFLVRSSPLYFLETASYVLHVCCRLQGCGMKLPRPLVRACEAT